MATTAPGSQRLRAISVFAAVLAVSLASPLLTGRALAAPPCPTLPGTDMWVFDGGDAGFPTDWDRPQNWNHNGNDNIGVPGTRFATPSNPTPGDDYACIPGGRTVVLSAGQSAHLLALDNRGSLTVRDGAKLEIKGDPGTQPSFSNALLLQGMLLGTGTLTIRTGRTLTWEHAAGAGAPSMTTREATAALDGTIPASTTPGRTVIAPGAFMVVRGLNGVNLDDARIIDNRGTTSMTVNAGAFIAADWGTTFRNTGTFRFTTDADYAQGHQGVNGALGLGRFINTGALFKTGGTGVSVIDAAYSINEGPAGPGTARVSSGVLSILSGNTVATVAPGAGSVAFGNGGCAGANSSCPAASLSATDNQFASLALPAGTNQSIVRIQERPVEAGVKGRPVDLTVPGESATSTSPMVFKISLDVSLLGGDTHLTLDVTHNGVAVPNCDAVTRPRCVDRAASSTVSGDVVMVIRTADNGRWRIL
jgi:hypothetical protein